jgi:hypothetical protein
MRLSTRSNERHASIGTLHFTVHLNPEDFLPNGGLTYVAAMAKLGHGKAALDFELFSDLQPLVVMPFRA